MPPPLTAGLYPYTRGGISHSPRFTLAEIPVSLTVNPSYRDDLFALAGDDTSARQLESFGLRVYHTFNDAPPNIHRDSAHKMKHWMCRWALKHFGEFLWVDWDTVLLRTPDSAFWTWCRAYGTPKFVQIPGYWATVNSSVYFASREWENAMDRSFQIDTSEPNDELLWASILPTDVHDHPEFWWSKRAVNVWTREDFALIGSDTYFAHVRHLEWAADIKSIRCL